MGLVCVIGENSNGQTSSQKFDKIQKMEQDLNNLNPVRDLKIEPRERISTLGWPDHRIPSLD